jgi:hypothetical protein
MSALLSGATGRRVSCPELLEPRFRGDVLRISAVVSARRDQNPRDLTPRGWYRFRVQRPYTALIDRVPLAYVDALATRALRIDHATSAPYTGHRI